MDDVGDIVGVGAPVYVVADVGLLLMARLLLLRLLWMCDADANATVVDDGEVAVYVVGVSAYAYAGQ